MDKEKILSKSRQQEDEGVQFINSQGNKTGFAFFTLVFAILILSAAFLARTTEQTPTIFALISLYLTFWVGESFAKYKYSAKRKELVNIFIGIIAVIASALVYILSILGVM